MRSTFRLVKVLGIDIDIHITFFLLLGLFALLMGVKGLVLIVGVFFFVTIHELCHSLAALFFGIKVKKITLLPIGGVASMPDVSSKPYQELIISIAGPLSNVLILVIFYYPLTMLLGKDALMYPILVLSGKTAYAGQFNVWAHIYWINLVLAVFNMIPAFPMDGGRVLRALLSYKLGRKKATAVAVKLGHIFALLFAYFGIIYGHIFLIIIAVFIYMAASGEGYQVKVGETIKKYTVKDILPGDFVTIHPDTTLAKIMELMFHTHQEDYPVMEDGGLKGVIGRREVVRGLHEFGKGAKASAVMRKDVPVIDPKSGLNVAQKLMYKYGTMALPVGSDKKIIGIVTLADINRVYIIVNEG